MRLQKFLSRAGVASRRAAEEMIAQGRVRVDGQVVARPGTTVDPARARVEVDGRPARMRRLRWVALHKPPGCACTRRDGLNRPTVYDLLPPDARHLPHVGRLDFMSEGLLLFSNDGDVAHRLLHPSSAVEREYEVEVARSARSDLPQRLREGVMLDDGPARARRATWAKVPEEGAPVVRAVLVEGRNRELRRMLAHLEVGVLRLRRVRFGPIRLGTLEARASRELTSAERARLAGGLPNAGGEVKLRPPAGAASPRASRGRRRRKRRRAGPRSGRGRG